MLKGELEMGNDVWRKDLHHVEAVRNYEVKQKQKKKENKGDI